MPSSLPLSRHSAHTAGQFKIFLLAALLAAIGVLSAPAAAQSAGPITFSVQDQDDNFIPIGEVEFCLNGGECLYADLDPGFPGHFYVDPAELLPDRTYTVMIYTAEVQVIYEIRDWMYGPEDYDPGYDKVIGCDKFLVFPQFHGDPQRRLDFRIDTTLNPLWEERVGEGLVIEEANPLKFPEFIFTAQANSMLGGKFNSDLAAAGGVVSVSLGWQASGIWRHGYPRREAWATGWLTCRELALTYGQNRYQTAEVMTPGRASDVVFHRANLSYGLARMNQAQLNHYGVAALISVGGIYDGSETLRYLEREYSLFGYGLQAHYRKMFISGGGLEIGATVEARAIYYPAEAEDDDYWFGLAPQVSVGVVVF